MEPLYALIFLVGFGSKGAAMDIDAGELFSSQQNCEVELARRLNNTRLPKGRARRGGACVLMEPAK